MDPEGGVAYKSGLGFGKRAFGAVKAQLNTELGDVFVVDGLKAGMRTLLSDQQQILQPTLKSVYA
ncbi:MAG: hypothetical protein M3Y49_11730 [Actinomycetota bacterium]|nr:hypothetical protein [Actinomycetota bacterium]